MNWKTNSLFIAPLLGILTAGCDKQSGPSPAATAKTQSSQLQVAEAMFQEHCKGSYRARPDVPFRLCR